MQPPILIIPNAARVTTFEALTKDLCHIKMVEPSITSSPYDTTPELPELSATVSYELPLVHRIPTTGIDKLINLLVSGQVQLNIPELKLALKRQQQFNLFTKARNTKSVR